VVSAVTKPYSEQDLLRQLVEDRTWRLKEISDLKSAILRADSPARRVLLRALVTISYAHWEGYVRFAARRYLEHIALRKFSFGDLERQFLRNYFLPRLASLSTNRLGLAERCRLVDDILEAGNQRFTRANADLVNTKSNLNFDVFADICLICGVDVAPFEKSRTFVDVVMLSRRNAVAHGEDTFVAAADMDQLADETIALMRQFGDALENKVVLQSFKAVAQGPIEAVAKVH